MVGVNKRMRVAKVLMFLPVMALHARELGTPIEWCPDAIREPSFLDNTKRCGAVGVWGRGFYRTAQCAFCNCDGTSTQPLSALWFNKPDFIGKEAFAEGSTANINNLWVLISTLSPRFRYTQSGAVVGMAVSMRLHEDKLHVGLRADIPFSVIDVDRYTKCGQNGTDLGGETLSDVMVEKPEVVNDLSGTPRGLLDFAYRLDFLSSLPLGPIGLSSAMPFVNYHNTDFTGDPITIANQDVTNSGGTSPVFVCRSDNGAPSGQFYQLEDYAATPLNAQGTNLAQNGYGLWAHGTDYSLLKTDLATQRTLWIIPGIVQRLHAVDQRPEALVIQAKLTQLLQLLDSSAEEFFARKEVCFTSQRSAGLGDLQLDFFTNYITSEKTWVEGVFGLTLPTAQKINNPQEIFKLPLGNNGHIETKLGLHGSWSPLRWLELEAEASYSHVCSAQENVAAAFRGATVKNVGPTTQAKISWNYFVGEMSSTFMNLDYGHQLGVTIAYQLYAKMKDKIRFCSKTLKDFTGIVQELDPCVLSCRTNVISHKGRVELFCRTQACDFFVGFQQVFAGKNAMKETSLHLGLSIGF
jgi:hypothetical protein